MSAEEKPQTNPTVISSQEGSNLFGVSMRAWLASIIVGTVCVQSLGVAASNLLHNESVMVEEPLYSMAMMALGFYFGQKTTNKEER